jgi:hypothetical protein
MKKKRKEKKRKKRVLKKWTSVRDIQNNGYSDARLKEKRKEINKIAHVFLAKLFPNSKKRDIFSRSKVELG